jgi:hypothetical protein
MIGQRAAAGAELTVCVASNMMSISLWRQGPDHARRLCSSLRTAMETLRSDTETKVTPSSPTSASRSIGFFQELMLQATSFLITELSRHDELLSTLVSVPVRCSLAISFFLT